MDSKGLKGNKEVKHFTAEPTAYNDYGETWNQIVKEYLKNSYKGADREAEIVAMGVNYKVLKRGQITAFYDASGNTLFDVENKRLEREYEQLMNGSVNIDTEMRENAKQKAKKKLEMELREDKEKDFSEPIISYLLERCAEDERLAGDVVQAHKTWKKCLDFIYEQAKKRAVGNRVSVRGSVIFAWAEDYYHKDDKAEEEKKEKKPKELENPKKKSREVDGQINMFSLMGI